VVEAARVLLRHLSRGEARQRIVHRAAPETLLIDVGVAPRESCRGWRPWRSSNFPCRPARSSRPGRRSAYNSGVRTLSLLREHRGRRDRSGQTSVVIGPTGCQTQIMRGLVREIRCVREERAVEADDGVPFRLSAAGVRRSSGDSRPRPPGCRGSLRCTSCFQASSTECVRGLAET